MAAAVVHQAEEEEELARAPSLAAAPPTFFVEGVKIGWPFPSVMLPQRQMAIHSIKALQHK